MSIWGDLGQEAEAESKEALLAFLDENTQLVFEVGLSRAKAIFQGELFAYLPIPDLHASATLEQITEHATVVERRSTVIALVMAAEKADIKRARKLRDAAAAKVIGLVKIVGPVAFNVAMGALKGAL